MTAGGAHAQVATTSLWRLGFFFAAYFATAGVFAPYFPLYLEHRGLSAAQIGIVLAMGQGMRLVGPNVWGYLADRTPHRLAILRWTTLATAACFMAMFLPGGFALVFMTMFGVNFFMTAQMPVTEAITSARLRGSPQPAALYGRLRACGSVGFIAFVLLAGPLFDWVGIGWHPYVGLAMFWVSVIAAYLVRDAFVHEPPHERISVRARMREPAVHQHRLRCRRYGGQPHRGGVVDIIGTERRVSVEQPGGGDRLVGGAACGAGGFARRSRGPSGLGS